LGQKFCDETEILPLLLAHGLVRRVRTIEIAVRPLGGDSFKITLDASLRTVKEAKAEIARVQGTATDRQELYRVAERADGRAVREDDAEPEPLEDESVLLGEGDVVAMAVKDSPLLWRTFAAGRVVLSEEGAVATHKSRKWSLTTTGIDLTEGKHYWEVEMLSGVGHTSPTLELPGQTSTLQENTFVMHAPTDGLSPITTVASTATASRKMTKQAPTTRVIV
jgi:hypothetical protein